MSYELQPRAMRVDEAAAYIGVHRSTMYRLARAGELLPRKILGRTVYLRDDLDRFLETRPSMLPAPLPKQPGE